MKSEDVCDIQKRERGKNIRVKTKSEREKKANPKSFISACSQRGNPTIVCYQLRFPAPIFSSSFFPPSFTRESERKRVELLFLPLPSYPVIHLSFFLFFLFFIIVFSAFFPISFFFISSLLLLLLFSLDWVVVVVHLLTEALNIIAELSVVMPGPPPNHPAKNIRSHIYTFPEEEEEEEEDSYIIPRNVFVLTEMCADEQRPRASMTSPPRRGWEICVSSTSDRLPRYQSFPVHRPPRQTKKKKKTIFSLLFF